MSKNTEKEALIAKIVDAIQDTKGEDIKILDLTKIENSVADYFVICSGNSNTQVSSIAGNVEKKVRNELQDRPWHIVIYSASLVPSGSPLHLYCINNFSD